MTQTLERAIAIAATAHAGQVDKGGAPYILHPLKVMLRMSTLEQRIVAVLHDVVEDCGVSLDDLREEGFSEEVLSAIESVTKVPGAPRRT
jgi:(p)ppGpp synthase/HD superfamily hydrolase